RLALEKAREGAAGLRALRLDVPPAEAEGGDDRDGDKDARIRVFHSVLLRNTAPLFGSIRRPLPLPAVALPLMLPLTGFQIGSLSAHDLARVNARITRG